MRNIMISITVIGCMIAAGAAQAGQTHKTNVDVSALAGIRLPFTGTDEHKEYLGIGNASTISLAEIRAERLIIVFVNSFCTICQSDAPIVNAMYEVVENDPSLKGRAKIVGIAPGNTKLEVEQFRSTFHVPFPILPDPDFAFDKAVPDNVRTPMVITAKRRSDRSIEVIHTHFGEIRDVELLVGKRFRSARLQPRQALARR